MLTQPEPDAGDAGHGSWKGAGRGWQAFLLLTMALCVYVLLWYLPSVRDIFDLTTRMTL